MVTSFISGSHIKLQAEILQSGTQNTCPDHSKSCSTLTQQETSTRGMKEFPGMRPETFNNDLQHTKQAARKGGVVY